MRACLQGSVTGDDVSSAGGLATEGSHCGLKLQGSVAGIGQFCRVMLGCITWEEAPAGCIGFLPLLTPPLSPLPSQGLLWTWHCLSEAERGSSPCSCHQVAEMGMCFLYLDPTECFLHVEVHLPPQTHSRGCPAAVVLSIGGSVGACSMHTPEPLPDFLGQTLWEIRPKNGYFYHMPRG